MTFEKFKEIIKSNRPEIEVFQHGEFTNKSTLSVGVMYNPNGKIYTYTGTYCDVLNKLGIKTTTKSYVDSIKSTIDMYIRTNGEDGFFGVPMDNMEEIIKYEKELENIEKNYIIV